MVRAGKKIGKLGEEETGHEPPVWSRVTAMALLWVGSIENAWQEMKDIAREDKHLSVKKLRKF